MVAFPQQKTFEEDAKTIRPVMMTERQGHAIFGLISALVRELGPPDSDLSRDFAGVLENINDAFGFIPQDAMPGRHSHG